MGARSGLAFDLHQVEGWLEDNQPMHRDELLEKGACKGYPPEMFFPQTTDGSMRGDITVGTAAEARAKAVCGTCLLRIACLEYATDPTMPEAHTIDGVWGGRNRKERKTLRRLRGWSPPTSPAV